jgi:hypothetical protein
LNPFLSHFFRKQCIELEQQFDFLKDLVASVPDMQGDGEDNHVDGDKGPRRWVAKTRYTGGEGQGHKVGGGWGMNQEERVLVQMDCTFPKGPETGQQRQEERRHGKQRQRQEAVRDRL